MDVHPTPFPPGNKTQPVKSKYKKKSSEEEAPKQKIKPIPTMHRRTFGTVRDPNLPEKPLPKSKPSNQIPLKQPPKGTNETVIKKNKKKTVSFSETKKSPAREGDGVLKTPVRPPFSAKPVRTPGTPYLSAEECSGCRFDRLETSSYWLGQIKSAEAVGKHFVAAAFFRLAHDCKAEPARNLHMGLKKYLKRHDSSSSKAEWEQVSGMYGILKNEHDTKSNMNLESGSKPGDVEEQQE
ncbi:hypothetical protein SSX86_018709 [Deinandra increscens subsp. villosa]|uniref:Uncharacterized protein n=1 Tax=Deinandra increscens subsp. villosa TaxID=3103831 RepID=A0AAP0GV06_9ASTR